MTFPTLVVTPGVGQTVNTFPNAGQNIMANSLGVAIASDQSNIPVTVTGRTTMAIATPVVTQNGAYAAGNEIGGLMTFAIGGAGTGGELKSMRVTSRSVVPNSVLTSFVFTANPAASTWTDNAAPAINASDIASLLCPIPLGTGYSGLGTHTIWSAGNIGMQFAAANLYVVLVAGSAITLTSTSTSDITVELGIRDD